MLRTHPECDTGKTDPAITGSATPGCSQPPPVAGPAPVGRDFAVTGKAPAWSHRISWPINSSRPTSIRFASTKPDRMACLCSVGCCPGTIGHRDEGLAVLADNVAADLEESLPDLDACVTSWLSLSRGQKPGVMVVQAISRMAMPSRKERLVTFSAQTCAEARGLLQERLDGPQWPASAAVNLPGTSQAPPRHLPLSFSCNVGQNESWATDHMRGEA